MRWTPATEPDPQGPWAAVFRARRPHGVAVAAGRRALRRRAIEFAAEVEAPVVMSDEGPVPEQWMSLAQGFDILCVSLEAILPYARSHGVQFALELHNALTARPDMLQKLLRALGETGCV